MRTYEVTGRPLVRNGRRLKVGARLQLSDADGAILKGIGRIRVARSRGKGKGLIDDEGADIIGGAANSQPRAGVPGTLPPPVGLDGAGN